MLVELKSTLRSEPRSLPSSRGVQALLGALMLLLLINLLLLLCGKQQ